MGIIEEEDEQSTTSNTTVAAVNPSSKKTTHNNLCQFPLEIVEEILLRLPVESILRSTSVSIPWYSLISHPSFSKLQLTHATSAHRTAFFLSAYDSSTNKRHYFSASALGGPLTLLLTVTVDVGYSSPSHLNGLICFTIMTWNSFTPLFINPSTRKVFKLPGRIHPDDYDVFGHLYGFDESSNQHKILLINTKACEFMVFDMSTRSWRKIEAEPPVGFTWDDNIHCYVDGGVCFDSKVHVMLRSGTRMFDILAFDFVTEKFSLISIPQDVRTLIFAPGEVDERYRPFIVKISGCLEVVVYDHNMSKIHIWLLQEYEKGVWVKENITLPEPWNTLDPSFRLSLDVNMDDEIVFNISKVSENVIIVPVYNRKSKSFRSLKFTLEGQFLSSKTMKFDHIKHYVDSMVPVQRNIQQAMGQVIKCTQVSKW